MLGHIGVGARNASQTLHRLLEDVDRIIDLLLGREAAEAQPYRRMGQFVVGSHGHHDRVGLQILAGAGASRAGGDAGAVEIPEHRFALDTADRYQNRVGCTVVAGPDAVDVGKLQNRVFEPVAQTAHMLLFELQIVGRQLHRLAHADDTGNVQGARTASAHMLSPMQQRRERMTVSDIKAADPFGTVELVGREAHEVDPGADDVDGDLAHRLHTVGMQQHTPLLADLRDLLDREDGSRLVVGPHDRHERRLVGDEIPYRMGLDDALTVDRQVGDAHALLLEPAADRRDGRMLHLGGDDVIFLAVSDQIEPDPFEDPVVRFGGAGGDDDVVFVPGADRLVHLIHRLAQSRMARRTEVVERVGIAVDLREVRVHRRFDFGVDHRGRVVVEVDFHHDNNSQFLNQTIFVLINWEHGKSILFKVGLI